MGVPHMWRCHVNRDLRDSGKNCRYWARTSCYIQTYKSQTFIALKTGSLPSLIGITLGLTIPNAILERNLGLSLALQAVNTASLSAGSGIAGGISDRETCVWVPHHTQWPLCGKTFWLSCHSQTNDRSEHTSLLKDVSAGMNRSHTSEELIRMYCKISWPSPSWAAMRRLAS